VPLLATDACRSLVGDFGTMRLRRPFSNQSPPAPEAAQPTPLPPDDKAEQQAHLAISTTILHPTDYRGRHGDVGAGQLSTLALCSLWLGSNLHDSVQIADVPYDTQATRPGP
jgi:hypothetical protein